MIVVEAARAIREWWDTEGPLDTTLDNLAGELVEVVRTLDKKDAGDER